MFKGGVYPGPQSKAHIAAAGATLHKTLSDCRSWGSVGGVVSCGTTEGEVVLLP